VFAHHHFLNFQNKIRNYKLQLKSELEKKGRLVLTKRRACETELQKGHTHYRN